jgi:hypothetical protein
MNSKSTMAEDDGCNVVGFVPRKATVWYRFIRWLWRLLKISEDPDAAEAFFESFR